MRSIVALYLFIGIVLLAVGHLATGPCPNRNLDPVNNVVFILTWPVYLYGDVVAGTMTPEEWLHAQACEGGLSHRTSATPKPPTEPTRN
ncbi:MAG TPA: hypothetical protein VET89_14310 [Stellaceae bacterium]|jgi:hypothetical protein|nr:hypothetical protein [Stellaceae bacterium]